MKKNERFVKNTLILSIGTFLPRLASFVTLPILTAFLTKEEYGTFDLITVLVSLLLPSVTLQLKAAAFRFLIDAREDGQEQKRIVTNILAFTAPVSVIALLVLFLVLRDVSPAIKLWVCLFYFLDILVETIRQVARGLSRNLHYSVSAVISAVGKMALVFFAVQIAGMGLEGAVIALCAGTFLSLVYLAVRIRIWTFLDFSLISRDALRKMIGYSWPMVPNELSMWVMRMSDRFVVTGFMGLAANAVYAVANKIPSIITLAQGALTLAWQENASVVSGEKDADEYYSRMYHVMMRIQAGFACLVLGLSPWLFSILIRGDYTEAYSHMPILSLAIFYASIATYLGGIYVARKQSKSVGITTVIAAIVNLAVDFACIRWIGLYAASVSTLVSYIFLSIYRMVDIRKIAALRYDRKQILLAHAVLAVSVGLFYLESDAARLVNAAYGLAAFLLLNLEPVKAAYRWAVGALKKR